MWWKTLRRFLTAEEVPRWFGLSLVLIYLVGLGSVARYGVSQARREGAVHFQRGSRYSVKLLAEWLSTLEGHGPSDPTLVAAYQSALREFAANVPVGSGAPDERAARPTGADRDTALAFAADASPRAERDRSGGPEGSGRTNAQDVC